MSFSVAPPAPPWHYPPWTLPPICKLCGFDVISERSRETYWDGYGKWLWIVHRECRDRKNSSQERS